METDAVGGGTEIVEFFEDAVEVAKVAEAGVECDGEDFVVRILQQLHGVLDAAFGEILDHAEPYLLFEGAAQVAFADACSSGQLIEGNRAPVAFVDVPTGVEQPGRWRGVVGKAGDDAFVLGIAAAGNEEHPQEGPDDRRGADGRVRHFPMQGLQALQRKGGVFKVQVNATVEAVAKCFAVGKEHMQHVVQLGWDRGQGVGARVEVQIVNIHSLWIGHNAVHYPVVCNPQAAG